ncbi:MAG: cell division protein FtsZ, partial [Bacteroidota bacterium]|nr:cell division protein FtsZ [Bacteroidota bacterium]
MENLTFDLPINKSNLIKVVGVGGGGSNAINYMYNQGINGVDFVVCNTDSQALQNSPVPNKIQLGVTLTEGLGAGADPERGAQAALESIDEINQMLNINTKMVFIAAGMGGGTGTGAAPIIGKLAKDLGILTVGIVTIPFQFEGKTRNIQAQDGIKKLRNNVDSLIVINNNKLRDVYGDLGFKKGFAKADEVLTKAAKGIAEVITNHYTQNIDLKDAKTVLENSGTAIMGSGSSSGDNRAKKAVELALDSPLLNDNRILGSKNVLLLIVSGEDEATIDEINTINELIQSEAGSTNIIMGLGEDINLQNEISVTIIATGFAPDLQQDIIHSEPQKIIHSLDDEQQL